jgi:hypothetical protein
MGLANMKQVWARWRGQKVEKGRLPDAGSATSIDERLYKLWGLLWGLTV